MKSNTYKWIIGCLLGIIGILVAFLITKENKIIDVSFSECLSLAATISSLILSVIAMLYTYYSGRDTMNVYSQIKTSISGIDTQVLRISEKAKSNSEALEQISRAMSESVVAIQTTSKVLETVQQGKITEQEKKAVIESMESTKNSMLMFLNRMK